MVSGGVPAAGLRPFGSTPIDARNSFDVIGWENMEMAAHCLPLVPGSCKPVGALGCLRLRRRESPTPTGSGPRGQPDQLPRASAVGREVQRAGVGDGEPDGGVRKAMSSRLCPEFVNASDLAASRVKWVPRSVLRYRPAWSPRAVPTQRCRRSGR